MFWLPPGNVPFGLNDADTKAAELLTPVGTPPNADPQASARAGAQAGAALGQRNFLNAQAARAMRLAQQKELPGTETSDVQPDEQKSVEPPPFR